MTTGILTPTTMKFRAVDPEGIYPMAPIYEPKTRKSAESIMKLHRNMGDEIEMLEEDDFDEAERKADAAA